MKIDFSITRDVNLCREISQVLKDAFEPFREFYTPEAFSATVVKEDVIKQRIESPSIPVFIAKGGNAVLGTAYARPITGKALYIGSIAVHPNFMHYGIGTALMNYVEKYAQKKRFVKLTLETYKYLEAANRLYERCGYKKTGVERDYFGVQIFEMQKILEPLSSLQKLASK